jgi:NADH-quinone oxidoreductase subunit J
MELYIFLVFSVLLIFSALRVITINNPVKAAIYLVFSFFASAVLWLLLNAEFLSIILVLVYVGAVMIMFLFVIMMLDINLVKMKEGFVDYFPLGLFVLFTIAILLIFFLTDQFSNMDKNIIQEINLVGDDNTKNLGFLLYTEFILAFEVAGIILLLGIISAITLTHKKNIANKYQNPFQQVSVTKSDRLKIIKDEDQKK